MNIPEQYLPVMPYLVIRNARAFLDFMKKVFGATEQLIVPDEALQIRHGELRIHDAVIMFADATDTYKSKTACLYIYVDHVNDVYHAALENGAKILEAPQQKEYGYTAGIEDAWGNQWYIVEA